MAAGNTGFFLNLFQLIPAKPFDGGFVVHAIYKWLLIPGTAFLIALTFYFKSVLLFVICIISFISLLGLLARERAARQQNTTLEERYSPVVEKSPSGPFDQSGDPRPALTSAQGISASSSLPLNTITQLSIKPAPVEQRVLIAIAYFGLAGMLSYLYWLSSNDLIVFLPHHK